MRWLQLAMTPALIGVAILGLLILLAWAAGRGRPNPAPGGHSALFRYNPLFRGFAAFAAFFLPVGLTPLVLAFPPRPDEVPYIIGAYVGFVALTLPLVWESAWSYVMITPAGIEYRSPWRSLRFMRWDEVEEVKYSPTNAWFVFRARDGRAIRVHLFMAGLPDMLRLVEQHLPAAALKGARSGYVRVGRPFPHLPDEPVLEARPPLSVAR